MDHDRKLNRNQYQSLLSLLAELEDIEDFSASTERLAVMGMISRDNVNELRKFCGLEEQ